jgi:hypothetical protein
MITELLIDATDYRNQYFDLFDFTVGLLSTYSKTERVQKYLFQLLCLIYMQNISNTTNYRQILIYRSSFRVFLHLTLNFNNPNSITWR